MKTFKRLFMISIVAFTLLCTVGWTSEQLEMTAPGGGEMDLSKNVVKYFGTSTHPVTAQWKDYTLHADYLEYNRAAESVHGKGKISLSQSLPDKRTLKCNEIDVDLQKELIIASREIVAQLDNQTTVTGGLLEWSKQNDWFKLTQNPQIFYKDWKLTGNVIEGKPVQGIITITGQIYGTSKDMVIKGGKLKVDRKAEQIYLQDNPIVIQGKNELSASEIIYDLKTKKVSAKGIIKSKMAH